MRRLDEEGFDEVFKVLQEKGITNKTLNSVTENQLKELGVRSLRMRIEAVDFIQKITDRQNGGKTVSDPIHGPIEMHPLCVKIIDTPQFQRLRFIKQLGGAYFVYPGAAHNRFEHSIGVSHLAGQLAISLKQQQPDLEISNTDILCVQIEGLCHDLGCGPFSHLFDKKFLPLAGKADITHKILSLRMFDHLVQSNDMESEFEKYGVSENDRIFIKEQIAGPQQQTEEWPYEGRCKGKGFLYEIVANKVNGIDVDKWDCFARDCHMLGIKNNFDHVRCITYARVLEEGGDLHICFKDKEAENFYDMFHTCKTLHRRAYQHPVGNIIETMIAEALLKAKNIIEKLGENGEKRHIRISEAVDDMEDYQKLTDSVFEQILWSTDDRLGESKNILMSIQKRQLYKCVGEIRSPVDSSSCKEDLIRNEVSEILKNMNSPLDSEDILIHLVFLDYGMSDKTPMDYVLFYKEHPNKVMKSKVSHLLPEKSAEQLIRCYCKKLDNPSIHQAAEAFNKWKDQHSCTVVGNKTVKSKKTEKEFDQNQYFWSYLPYLE